MKFKLAGAMTDDFGRVLQSQMVTEWFLICDLTLYQEYYSNPSNDRMTKVKGDLEQLTGIMVQNIGI